MNTEQYESVKAPNPQPEQIQVVGRRATMRLIGLATNFNDAVRDLPNGQRYIDEPNDVAERVRLSQLIPLLKKFYVKHKYLPIKFLTWNYM